MRAIGVKGLRLFPVIAVAMLFLLLSSCELGYKEGADRTLRLELADSYNLSTAAYTAPEYFKIQVIGKDDIVMRTLYTGNLASNITIPDLALSTYTVRVYGYESNRMQTILGYSTTSIEADNSTAVAVVALTTEANLDGKELKGHISIDMSWDAGMDIDTANMKDSNGNIIASLDTSTAEEAEDGLVHFLFSIDLATGRNKDIFFEFIQDGKVLGVTPIDSITVYSGQINYSEKNTHDGSDPYQNILQLSSPTLTVTETDGILLSWNSIPYAESYEIYRIENGNKIRLGETDSCSYTDYGPLPETSFSYQVVAVNRATGHSAESNTVEMEGVRKTAITVTLPEGPASVEAVMEGISKEDYVLRDGEAIRATTEAIEGIVTYRWYFNGNLISESLSVEITSDDVNLDVSTVPARQNLTLTLTDNMGRVYSGTAVFTYLEN